MNVFTPFINFPIFPIHIHQPHRIPRTIRVRRHTRIPVRQRIHAQPDAVIRRIIPRAEVTVTRFAVAFFAGEGVARTFVVSNALVNKTFSKGQVTQVLYVLCGGAGYPRSTVEVVGVVEIEYGVVFWVVGEDAQESEFIGDFVYWFIFFACTKKMNQKKVQPKRPLPALIFC